MLIAGRLILIGERLNLIGGHFIAIICQAILGNYTSEHIDDHSEHLDSHSEHR